MFLFKTKNKTMDMLKEIRNNLSYLYNIPPNCSKKCIYAKPCITISIQYTSLIVL